MKSALRWGGSLVLLALLAWKMDWVQVGQCFVRLYVGYWLLALLIFAVCQLGSSLRWRLLSQVVGFRGSLLQYVGIYHIGMFFNLLLPTSVGGDVVRIWYQAGLPSDTPTGRRARAALAVFADRLNGLLMLVVLACVSVVLSPIAVPGWISWTVAGIGAAVLGGCLTLVVARPLVRMLIPRFPARVQAPLTRVLQAGRLYLAQPRSLLLATLLSLLLQALNIVIVCCVGLALGLDVPLSAYGTVYSLATLLTLLPLSINGVGLREAAYVLLLAPFGVGAPQAIALSFLTFLVMVTCSLTGLGFYLLGRYPRFRPTSSGEPNHDGAVGCHSDQGRTRQSATAA